MHQSTLCCPKYTHPVQFWFNAMIPNHDDADGNQPYFNMQNGSCDGLENLLRRSLEGPSFIRMPVTDFVLAASEFSQCSLLKWTISSSASLSVSGLAEALDTTVD